MNNNLIIHAIPSELIPLYVLVCGATVTIWFLNGLLNPFIDAVLAINKCAIDSILTLFFRPIHKLSDAIDKRIRLPIQAFIKRVPTWVHMCGYIVVAIGIIALDQKYLLQIFNYDETMPYYPIHVFEKKYWISLVAIVGAGYCLMIPVFVTISAVMRWIGKLLDKDFQINILIYK
jgi:hypothetical protein